MGAFLVLGCKNAFSNPPVIIFATFDVVLAEVGAGLHLDENEGRIFLVLNPVPCTLWDIHALAGGKRDFLLFADDDGLSRYGVPVLQSAHVTLQTEAMPRMNDNTFDLMIRLIRQYGEMPPRSMFGIICGHPVPQRKNGASGRGAVSCLAICCQAY